MSVQKGNPLDLRSPVGGKDVSWLDDVLECDWRDIPLWSSLEDLAMRGGQVV